MEIKKGMYIRYAGNIDKVFGVVIDKNNSSLNRVYAENETVFFDEIEKASFNLIDLVKKGDYVNGYPVVDIMDSYDTETKRRINRTVYIDKPCAGVKIWWTPLLNGDIKEVITKEQFEDCKYVVERDN